MRDLHELSATEAAARIGRGEITSEDLVRDWLARIAAREDKIGALALIEPGRAIEEARLCDATLPRSQLHGIAKGEAGMPVGIQLVGDLRDEQGLLAVARWVEARLSDS